MSSCWPRAICFHLSLMIFTTSLLLSTAVSVNAAPADDEYTLGLTLYGQKRWDLASETFRTYLKAYPDHSKAPLAKLYLAQSLVNQEEYKEAREVLRGFLKAHPQNKNTAQAMYRVAECSYFLNDYPTAISDFEAFLKQAPNDQLVEWALPYLADAYLRTGKHAEAQNTFEQSLDKFPKGRFVEDSQFGLARSLELQNQVEPAIKQYQKLINDPDSQRLEESLFNVGMLYFQQKNYQNAAETFTKLSSLNPSGKLIALSHLNAGYAYYSLGEWEKALDQFSAADQSEQYRESARYWIAQTYKSSGDLAKSEQVLQTLLQQTTDADLKPKILYQLADSQFQLRKYDEALNLFLDYQKQFPQGESVIDAWLSSLECCLLTNRLGQGWELSEQKPDVKMTSVENDEQTLLQCRLLAAADSETDPLPESLGDRETRLRRALPLLTKILDGKPDNQLLLSQQTRYQTARIAQEMGDDALAVSALEPITVGLQEQTQLQLPETWLLLANSQYELGKYEDALGALDQFEKLSKDQNALSQAYIVRINVLTKMNQFDEAGAVLAKLQQSNLAPQVIAEATFQLAEMNYARQNWMEAQKQYQQVLNLQLNDEWTIKSLSALGWSYFEDGKFDEAVASFEKLKKQFPNAQQVAADAGYMQGMALLKADQELKAAETFMQTAQSFRSPQEVAQGNEVHHLAYRAAREAARTYRNLNKVDKSAEAYRLAYEELRKQPETRNQNLDKLLDEWALLHYENEEYEKADEVFEILINERPESDRADDAQLSLAESDYINGDLNSARSRFEKLIGDSKSDAYVKTRSLYQLVMIAGTQKDSAAVKKFSDEYLKAANGQTASLTEIGEIESQLIQLYLEQDQLEEAEKQLTGLKARVNNLEKTERPEWYPKIYVMTGEIARRQKKYDQVQEVLETVREEYPESAEREQVEVLAGRTKIAQANFEDAEKQFRAVLDRAAGNKTLAAAQSQFYLAETALIQKDYQLAIKEYIRMAILFPGFPDLQSAALYQAGQCDEVLGNVEQAIQNYENLIRLYPESEFTKKAEERVKTLKAST
ncbi:tetratricopeptide repeat protein [Rubinisphaera sp.]|uniref:tetratricopeptide repeat protein n=1 Tax=Rubinisphaera sp. TaxID=2024857 RepID=UPI0025CF1105|nr:tetratricopeptide repeat protein [Rubinisphaera sp.]